MSVIVDIAGAFRVVVTVVRDRAPVCVYGEVKVLHTGRTVHFVRGEGATHGDAVRACVRAAREWASRDVPAARRPTRRRRGPDSVPPSPSWL